MCEREERKEKKKLLSKVPQDNKMCTQFVAATKSNNAFQTKERKKIQQPLLTRKRKERREAREDTKV